MCFFRGLPTLLIVGSVYPPLNTDHSDILNWGRIVLPWLYNWASIQVWCMRKR